MPRGRTTKKTKSHSSPSTRDPRTRSLTRSTKKNVRSDLHTSRSKSLVGRKKLSSKLSSMKSLPAKAPHQEPTESLLELESVGTEIASDNDEFTNGSDTTTKTGNPFSSLNEDRATSTRNESVTCTNDKKNNLQKSTRSSNRVSQTGINKTENEDKASTSVKESTAATKKDNTYSQTISRSRSRTRSISRTRSASMTRSASRTRSISRTRSTSRSRSKSQSRSMKGIIPPWLKLYKRNLAMAFVGRNKDTNLWITNIEMSENPENNFIRSFHSEEDAKECAYAYSPPKMIPFESSPNCFLCDSPFHALRRRAAHCQNCGVCICKKCSVSWDKTMVPSTYNAKNSSTVCVCKTCDYLSSAFRCALLDSNYKHALKLYMTGNINLRCPFANVNPGIEIMYPIHCAASIGNIELLRWLVDTHKCPYNMSTPRLRSSITKRNQHGNHDIVTSTESPTSRLIPTSNGRTILDLALENDHEDILQYLTKEKKILLPSQNMKSEDNKKDTASRLILKEIENKENEDLFLDLDETTCNESNGTVLDFSSRENWPNERSVSKFERRTKNRSNAYGYDKKRNRLAGKKETHDQPTTFNDMLVFCDVFFSAF